MAKYLDLTGLTTFWGKVKAWATATFAGKSHTHTKSQITDFPASLKNPAALKFTGASTQSYDGSQAITVNIPSGSTYTLPTATASVLGGVKLGSDTAQTVAAQTVSTQASRTYAIQKNASGQLVVNVPWTDTNTVYTLPAATNATLGGVKIGTGLNVSKGVISVPNVTTSAPGLMSSADKKKLDKAVITESGIKEIRVVENIPSSSTSDNILYLKFES